MSLGLISAQAYESGTCCVFESMCTAASPHALVSLHWLLYNNISCHSQPLPLHTKHSTLCADPMAQGRSTQIISMIKWIRTSRLSIKNSLSLQIAIFDSSDKLASTFAFPFLLPDPPSLLSSCFTKYSLHQLFHNNPRRGSESVIMLVW